MSQLEDFAEENKRHDWTCFVCRLRPDLRRQVEDARVRRNSPLSYNVIVAWLTAEGVDGGNASKLRDHFYQRHHETRPIPLATGGVVTHSPDMSVELGCAVPIAHMSIGNPIREVLAKVRRGEYHLESR